MGKSLVLYYLEASPPARSVDLVINALGLSAEHKVVNLFERAHFSPDYVKINPLRTVPAINDDGFILYESRAIMTYLVSNYGKDDSLYPRDLSKRAIVDQRLHYSNDVFFVLELALKPLLFELKKPNEQALGRIREAQENIEKLLTGQKFIAGDSLTVADYSLVTIVDALGVFCPPEGKFPLTEEWFRRCQVVMKNFSSVNKNGAEQLVNVLSSLLAMIP
uniref:Uncharacterized protein n=1 Tax=Graphocephala atropunctata TaxID=36148 RepID=A0A1B6L4W0_9HEMI